MEILTGRERRRRWSTEDKLRILSEASAPGVSAAEVARRHDLCPQQIYRWRREFRASELAPAEVSFLPVELAVSEADRPKRKRRSGSRSQAEIVLASGRLLRVDSEIETEALRRLVRVLEEA